VSFRLLVVVSPSEYFRLHAMRQLQKGSYRRIVREPVRFAEIEIDRPAFEDKRFAAVIPDAVESDFCLVDFGRRRRKIKLHSEFDSSV